MPAVPKDILFEKFSIHNKAAGTRVLYTKDGISDILISLLKYNTMNPITKEPTKQTTINLIKRIYVKT